MADELDVSTGESSPPPEGQGAPASTTATATTPPQDQGPAKEPPFHTHPRWQQMMHHNRGLPGQVSQLTQELERLKQAQQQAPAGRMTPEQQFELQQAGAALENLIRQHPKLAWILDERAPKILDSGDRLESLSKAQFNALTRQGRNTLGDLFKADNLPPETHTELEDLIAAKLKMNPERLQRYMAGDIDVVREVYTELKPFVEALRRTATTTTLEAKGRVSRLPPRPVGGGPGQPALPKLQPGKEREYLGSVAKMARNLLSSG